MTCTLGGGCSTAGSDAVDVMLARSEDEATRAMVALPNLSADDEDEDEDDDTDAMGDTRLLVLRVASFNGAAAAFECTLFTLLDFVSAAVEARAFSALAYGMNEAEEEDEGEEAEGARELATDSV